MKLWEEILWIVVVAALINLAVLAMTFFAPDQQQIALQSILTIIVAGLIVEVWIKPKK